MTFALSPQVFCFPKNGIEINPIVQYSEGRRLVQLSLVSCMKVN